MLILIRQKLPKATNNSQRKFFLTISETQCCLIWRIFVDFAMESTFLNTVWRQRKEQKDKYASCWTPYLGPVYTGLQGRPMIKLLCLSSHEIAVFSASTERSFVSLFYLSLIAKESWSGKHLWGPFSWCAPPPSARLSVCLLIFFRSALTNGRCVKLIEWLLILALDSSLPTKLHRNEMSYRSSFGFPY